MLFGPSSSGSWKARADLGWLGLDLRPELEAGRTVELERGAHGPFTEILDDE